MRPREVSAPEVASLNGHLSGAWRGGSGSWVEVNGFEPSTSAVRRQRSTGLSYTPRKFQRSKGVCRDRADATRPLRVFLQPASVLVESPLDALLHRGDREVTAGLLNH
jgi:hypothetical protein